MAKGWSVSAIQNLVRSVAGYQDPNRIAQDVGEVLAEQRSLVPKVEQFGESRSFGEVLAAFAERTRSSVWTSAPSVRFVVW